jgi:hypothetical protein
VTADGDQRVAMPRTTTGLACAAGTSDTTRTHAHDVIPVARINLDMNTG